MPRTSTGVPRSYLRNRRRRTSRPYRGYSYGRPRARPVVRDSAFRLPVFYNTEPELPWLKPIPVEESSPPVVPEPEPEPEPEAPPEPEIPEVELATKLHIQSLDLHIDENVLAHKTDLYACVRKRTYKEQELDAQLVIRRGQTFKMTLNFDRPYDVKKNDITLVFSLAVADENFEETELMEKVKLIEETVTSFAKDKWGAAIVEKKDTSLTINVFTPAFAAVGEWDVGVRTIVDVKNGEDIIWQYNHNSDIRVLFNPWCPEDLVYMQDKDWLQEAVLNDSGFIYAGSYWNMGGRPWMFGQFEESILDAALHLLRKSFGFYATPSMGSVVRVVRALSKIVNSNDEEGVLWGKWGKDYDDGTKPTTWVGSVKILRQYMREKQSVKYGQCWVFSGVLTTVCRALGIPCRSITNFASAHNSDSNLLSIDILIDDDGEEIDLDSIWNFHCWNEAWMSRPDLETGEGEPKYTGWQVIDATPQERSDGVFQCGPCPLQAVKEGELNVGNDTAFVFGEVNGDIVRWIMSSKTEMIMQIKRDIGGVGKNISTRKPEDDDGPTERLDVTNLYKYEEGTAKEREIVTKANKMFRLANVDVTRGDNQIKYEGLEMTLGKRDDFKVGEPFFFTASVKNTGIIEITVSLSMVVLFKNYRNADPEKAASMKMSKTFKPGESFEGRVDIDVPTSIKRPDDDFCFSMTAVCKSVESENQVVDSQTIILERPGLLVEGPKSCKRGQLLQLKLSFTNPVPVPLTEGKVLMEGNLIPAPPNKDAFEIGTIEAGGTWSMTLEMQAMEEPRYAKYRSATFSLSTKELGSSYGRTRLNVEDCN